MKKSIILNNRQIELVLSLLKPYAEGCPSTYDKRGFYFKGINNVKYYCDEIDEIIKKLLKGDEDG